MATTTYMPPPSAPAVDPTKLNPEGAPPVASAPLYQQPAYVQPPQYGQTAPAPMGQPVSPMYAQQPGYGQPAAGQPMYGQQPMYAQQPMYGQQPMYAQQQQVYAPMAPTAMVVTMTGIAMEPVCPDAVHVMATGQFRCCEDCETCICGFFFPPCAFGRNGQRSGLGDCCGDCCIYWMFGHFPCLGGSRRTQFHVKLRMADPGCCANCCFHMWCRQCALAQEGRASKLMEAHRMNPNHSAHQLSAAAASAAAMVTTTAKPVQEAVTR